MHPGRRVLSAQRSHLTLRELKLPQGRSPLRRHPRQRRWRRALRNPHLQLKTILPRVARPGGSPIAEETAKRDPSTWGSRPRQDPRADSISMRSCGSGRLCWAGCRRRLRRWRLPSRARDRLESTRMSGASASAFRRRTPSTNARLKRPTSANSWPLSWRLSSGGGCDPSTPSSTARTRGPRSRALLLPPTRAAIMRRWWRGSRASSTLRRSVDGTGWTGGLRRERPDEAGAADAGRDAESAGAAQGRGRRGERRRRHGQGEDGRRPDPARDRHRPRGDRPRGGRDPRRHGPGRGQRGAARRPGPGRLEDGRDHRGHGRPPRNVSGEGPAPLSRLVAELSRLPGIGQRTAQRLALPLLRAPDEEAAALAAAIREVKEKVGLCERCFNLSEGPLCRICSDSSRDQETICVVEEPADVIPIERTHEYRGLYHVLGGAPSLIAGVDAGDLKIAELLTRVAEGDVREVVLATNPTTTGEATALYIADRLRGQVSVPRLASALPIGADLEHADEVPLGKAFTGRRALD